MGSQKSQAEDTDVLCLLEEASQWTEEETRQKLPSLLPIFKNLIQNSPSADDGLRAATFVISSLMPHLEVEMEAFQLISAILPPMQNFLTFFLEECIENGRENTEKSNEIIQHQVIQLVENCLSLVHFLLQADSICVESVAGILEAFLLITNNSLQHISNSKDVYGDHIELISDSIGALCHSTVDLSSNFATLISKFSWDTFNEKDLEVIISLCEQMCITASYLSELSDLRAFVSVWRTYANLVSQHHKSLITNLDIGKPLAALVKEIKSGFYMLMALLNDNASLSDRNKKLMQRTLKTINFCLKIVVSLCEKFRGYLHCAHPSLVSLLFQLLRFSPGNIMLQSFPSEIQKEVESLTTIGIEPVLSHLRNDEDFIKVVLEAQTELLEEISEDMGSFLLLIVTIVIPPSATVMAYIKRFLCTIFTSIQETHVSLSLPCMMNGVMYSGRQQSEVSLYEHILTRVCVLVANLDSDQFNILEEMLMKWLLSGNTWPALLAADVWCFIARYGTSKLCLHHCLLLLEVLPHTVSFSHQSLITASLLIRLVPKLSESDKEKFMHSIKENSATTNIGVTALWSHFLNEEGALRDSRYNMMTSSINNMKSISSSQAVYMQFHDLMEELESLSPVLFASSIFSSCDPSLMTVIQEFTVSLASLWNRIPENLMGATAVDQMIVIMVEATIAVSNNFSIAQLYQIMALCRTYAASGGQTICITISSFIEALGHISLSFSPDQELLLELIAECIAGLLSHSDPLIHQFGLDTFISYGQHTVHENVLPMCLKGCDEEVKEKVTKYLKQEPQPSPGNLTRLSLLQIQNKNICMNPKSAHDSFISLNNFINANHQPYKDIDIDEISEKGEKVLKRRKLNENEESYNIKAQSLLRSLEESKRRISDLMSCGLLVKSDDINIIKRYLQESLLAVEKLCWTS